LKTFTFYNVRIFKILKIFSSWQIGKIMLCEKKLKKVLTSWWRMWYNFSGSAERIGLHNAIFLKIFSRSCKRLHFSKKSLPFHYNIFAWACQHFLGKNFFSFFRKKLLTNCWKCDILKIWVGDEPNAWSVPFHYTTFLLGLSIPKAQKKKKSLFFF
jgi:hypothetical protein